MQDFLTAYNEFFTRFDAFMTRYYSSGIAAPVQKLSEIVAEHPLNDPAERETNLFLWIAKAALRLPGCDEVLETVGLAAGACDEVLETVRSVGGILADKNADYGNSARDPSPFFGGALSSADCILVRIGDKIARADHLTGGSAPRVAGESLDDTVRDFIGYAILLYITLQIDGAPLHLDSGGDGSGRAALFVPRPMTYRELASLVNSGDFEVYLPADVADE